MNTLVSIVIPTYNRALDLERALKSLLAQTYIHWEALIVDNHSKDNTDDLVKGFNDSRMKLFKIHNFGVIAASRNLGIKHAQGEYIAFLDSDDWWTPQKLEESLKYLEKGADLVYHDLFVATKYKQRFFRKKDRARNLCSPVFVDLICHGNALKNSSVVVSKNILREIGGLSEDAALITIEDYDAWLRAAKITEKFKRIPKSLGYYWAGGGNTSNSERAITCLEAFEIRYGEDISKVGICAGFWWLYYSKGRAYYLLGSYAMAKNAFNKIHLRRVPLLIATKILWMSLIIRLFHNPDLRRQDC